KRLLVPAALLVLCIALPPTLEVRHGVKRYLTKESTVDMKNMNHIFFGWVDLDPDEWALYSYNSKTDWTELISSLNASFSRCVPGRIITAANFGQGQGGRQRDGERPLHQGVGCQT